MELVRCLGLVADCLRRGDDDRLAIAMGKLQALDTMATRTFSDDTSLVITIMRDVADSYVAATFTGRFGRSVPYGPNAARDCLPTPETSSAVAGASSGHRSSMDCGRLLENNSSHFARQQDQEKTLVANLALIKELLFARVRRPSGSPGALHRAVPRSRGRGRGQADVGAWARRLRHGPLRGGRLGITDYWLTSEEPVVLIATVEKAEALMRNLGQMIMARLRLLIIDEAHQVVSEANEATRLSFSDHNNRSIRLEALVSRILLQRPDVARIALTAVAGGSAGPVARWVEGRPDADPVGGRYRSTRQVIGVLETAPNAQGRVLLDLMNGLPLYIRGEEDPVYLRLQIAVMPQLPAQWRNSLNRFNCLSVLWTALHIVDEDQRILISVTQAPEQTMRWFKEALERDDWRGAVRFRPPDGPLRDRFDEARAACLDYCGADSFELFLLDRASLLATGRCHSVCAV